MAGGSRNIRAVARPCRDLPFFFPDFRSPIRGLWRDFWKSVSGRPDPSDSFVSAFAEGAGAVFDKVSDKV
jgi:hypothetical protein